MLIAIDHGNYAVKTPRFSFISGLSEHAVKPPLADEVLEYEGKYWTLSGKRLPYMRDKTKDERYFILSLFVIAKAVLRPLSRLTWPSVCRRNISACFEKSSPSTSGALVQSILSTMKSP